jgi:anti-sigma factor RsiW
MNINRQNYEEYFLLYTDNELSAAERAAVEQFAAVHPDLAVELEMLQQSKLVPDEAIRFTNKEQLLKTETSSSVNLQNYEEFLLSYIDDELTAEQKTQVEQFVARHPAVQDELATLQQVKLQPDPAITFPGKESLYRYAEPVRMAATVVRMKWWKVAVAAAVLFFAGISTLLLMNKPAQTNQQAANTAVAIPKPSGEVGKTTAEKATRNADANNNEIPRTNDALASSPRAEQSHEHDRTKKITPGENSPLQKQTSPETTINETIAKTDAPVKNLNTNIGTQNNNGIIDNRKDAVTDITPGNNTIAFNNNPLKQNNTTTVTNKDDQPYNNETTSPKISDETGAIFASNDDSKSRKVRGFFRKATRLFERTTNISAANDDDKVLIGVLAVKL